MTARLMRLVVLLVALASPAWAQITAPNRLDVVERVADACPGLILNDHAFTDAVASLLAEEFPEEGWGRNAKRGNRSDPSHDAIWYPNPRSPLGGSIVDIIAAAGSPGASPAWIDQTQETVRQGTTGGYIRPSGVLPACLTGGSTPVPPVSTPPPATSTPAVDLRPVLDALARLQADVDTLKTRPVQADPDAALDAFLRDMVGDGPDGDGPLPPHVTDIKERLDVIRVTLEQLAAWLRGRSIFRF